MARKNYLEIESKELDITQDQGVIENAKEPSVEELEVAGLLEGSPHIFDNISVAIFKSLAAKGIAADAGDEGWMRGYKWHDYIPRR